MILVVMMHVDEMHYSHFFAQTPFAGPWDILTSVAKPARMPTFFAISGFLASRAVWRPWSEIFRKRVLLLYYLYALWLAISLGIFRLLYAKWDSHFLPSLFKGIANQLIFPQTLLWFLYALVIFFIFARTLRALPWIITFSFAILLSAFSETFTWPTSSYLARSLLFFLIGAYIPTTLSCIAERASPRMALWSGASFLALTGLILVAGKMTPGIWLPASVAGVWFCLTISKLLASTRAGWPLIQIGQKTLPIFVLHGTFLTLLNYVCDRWASPIMRVLSHNILISAIYPVAINILVLSGTLAAHRLLLSLGQRWLFSLPTWTAPKQPVSRGNGKPPAPADPVRVEPIGSGYSLDCRNLGPTSDSTCR